LSTIPPRKATTLKPLLPISNFFPTQWDVRHKHLITFQLYLLNFSVYIASFIYVPGEGPVMEGFGASEVVATLGLSVFTM
jgi:DHA1 family multidrug resistance protein-like MFS transporter